MVVVAFAPARSSRSTALLAALTAALGPARLLRRGEDARAAAPGAVLLLDLRGAGPEDQAWGRELSRQAVGLRVLALCDADGRRPPGCDAVLTAPVFLDEVIGWCRRALSAPPDEAVLSDLAQGLSHEILNPLSSVMMELQLLQTRGDAPDWAEPLDRIDASHRRIRDIVQEVSEASERGPVAAVPGRLEALLSAARARVQEREPGLAGRLRLRCRDGPVNADPALLRAALADLWTWLLRAGGDDDELLVDAGARDEQAVCIRSQAPVPRLPADAAARLFTPLWARQALGLRGRLSLTSARAAFLRHGGEMLATSQRAGHLTVEALLPRNCNPVRRLLP